MKQEPVAFTTNPAASSAGYVLDLDTDDDASGDPDTQMVIPPLRSTNEAHPVGQHAPPVGQQALPVVQQAPPTVQQALAVVQQAPPAAAQAPPSGRKLFADMNQKEMQNFFQNGIKSKKCPPEVKAAWELLKKLPQSDASRQECVRMISESMANKEGYTDPYFDTMLKRTREISKTVSDKNTAGWRSYKFVCDKEGPELTNEFMRLKLVEFRRHIKFGNMASILQYPLDQEIWWSQTMFETVNSTKDATRLEMTDTDVPADAAIALVDAFDHVHRMVPGTHAAPTMPDAEAPVEDVVIPPPSDVDIRAAVKNGATAHNAWDKGTRDWNGTLTRSSKNTRTAGTEPETELTKCIAGGKDADNAVISFENKMKAGDAITAKDLEKQKDSCIL